MNRCWLLLLARLSASLESVMATDEHSCDGRSIWRGPVSAWSRRIRLSARSWSTQRATRSATGTHTYDGVKHAEVLAIEQAGARARGGTLYLNLEPCSHQGRTGPCADAVIAAGITRVVCSMQDPNPQVAGQGFARLRARGIHVDVGLLEAEAKPERELREVHSASHSAGHAEGGDDARRQDRAAAPGFRA